MIRPEAVADVLIRVGTMVQVEAAEEGHAEEPTDPLIVLAYLAEALVERGDLAGYARGVAEWKPQVQKLQAEVDKLRAAAARPEQDSMPL